MTEMLHRPRLSRALLGRFGLSIGICLLAVTAVSAADGPVKVTAAATTTDVGVGQRFGVAVSVKAPAGTTLTFPTRPGDDKVELVLEPPPKDGPPPADRRLYQATAFALDEVAVPPVKVDYRLADGTTGSAASEAIPLRIASALAKGENAQRPADIRPPVKLPIGVPFWVAVGVLAVSLVAGIVWIARRRRPRPAKAVPEAPPVPADVEARAALDGLAASGLVAAGQLKLYYFELLEIAKRYLERRLDAPVLEMTSMEVLAFLKSHRHGRELSLAVLDITGTADLVKFARGAATVTEAERHLAAIRGMVETLESRLKAEESAAAGTGGGRAA